MIWPPVVPALASGTALAFVSGIVALLAGLGLAVQHLFAKCGHFRVAAVRSPLPPFSFGRNRLWVELCTAGLVTLLLLSMGALFYAHMVVYRSARLLSKLGLLIEVPYVTPGAELAMAVILLYLRPLPMTSYSHYNTLCILLLSYLARFLTIQLLRVVSDFRQFPREMLEAAEIFDVSFRAHYCGRHAGGATVNE